MKTKDAILSLIRHILTFTGGILVARGIFSEAAFIDISGSLLTLIGTTWGVVDEHLAANSNSEL